MVVVAVAGGTGAVGRTMVKAMVSSGHHMVYVLSRTADMVPGGGDCEQPKRLLVDYSSVEQIAATLRRHRIEAVVSALLLVDQQAAESQVRLIRGAALSGTVTKFIPSEFHLDFHAPIQGIDLFMKKFQLESERELERQPHLTWTLIRNGLFLDYLGTPFQPKAKPTELMRWCIFVDLENEVCVFPGDGTKVMTFTHSSDLAAYVERMISLPAKNWPRHSLIKANRLEIKDLAGIVAKVTGRTFRTIYDAEGAVRRGQITQLPFNEALFADEQWGDLYRLVEKETMVTLLSDGYDMRGSDLAEFFPGVEITSVEDFLRQCWLVKETGSSNAA
ncbi:FAD dependent oxidoreductase [Apiospora arundinis]